MTTLQKSVLAFFGLAALLGAVAFFGLSPFSKEVTQQVFGSPVGTTFNTAKVVAVNITPSTQGATSTSVLNTDATARYIANYGMVGCTGVGTSQTDLTGTGLAALLVQAATTSVANQGLQGNTNYAMNLTVSTSTTFVNSSTSTPSVMAGYWAAGTYMTFTFNATNTAACTVEMDYLAS